MAFIFLFGTFQIDARFNLDIFSEVPLDKKKQKTTSKNNRALLMIMRSANEGRGRLHLNRTSKVEIQYSTNTEWLQEQQYSFFFFLIHFYWSHSLVTFIRKKEGCVGVLRNGLVPLKCVPWCNEPRALWVCGFFFFSFIPANRLWLHFLSIAVLNALKLFHLDWFFSFFLYVSISIYMYG